MNSTVKQILHTFDEYIFGFMRADIDAAIRGKANYLAALGVVSYTEILGGLRTGKLGLKNYSSSNFNAFLPYLGKEYRDFAPKDINLFDLVRCGLVHNYFVKGRDSSIWMSASSSCGIIASAGGPTIVIVDVYRDHLFTGATQFRDEILEGSDSSLVPNFETAMRNIDRPLK